MLFTNRIIHGYKIISRLNEGGMGTVYLAEHELLHTKAVIKIMLDKWQDNEQLKERFIREARILSQLNHPNVVRLINFDIHPELGYVIIMEYVEGIALSKLLQEQGRNGLNFDRVRMIFNGLLDAFDYAHSKGIVHRDIKPDNIMITSDNIPVVLDFGIAKIAESDLTNISQVLGTPSYMSPEQVTGAKTIDQRSDIYSLGIILYMMLQGNIPYEQCNSHFALMNAIVNEPIPLIKDKRPYLASNIDTILQKATEKKPENRYSSCKEMKIEFEQTEFVFTGLGNWEDKETVTNKETCIDKSDYDEIRPFSCGRAAVKKKDMFRGWGFIDEQGDEIIPCQFERVEDFNIDGQASVLLSITGDCSYSIDVFGKITEVYSIFQSKYISIEDVDVEMFMSEDFKIKGPRINIHRKKSIQQEKIYSILERNQKADLDVNLNEIQFFSFCHNCGNEIEPYVPKMFIDRNLFNYHCPNCGKQDCLGYSDTTVNFCSVCGNNISSYANNNCPNCGAPKGLHSTSFFSVFSQDELLLLSEEFMEKTINQNNNVSSDLNDRGKNLPQILPPAYFKQVANILHQKQPNIHEYAYKHKIKIAWATPFYNGYSVFSQLGYTPSIIDLNLNRIEENTDYFCASDFRMGFVLMNHNDTSIVGYHLESIYIPEVGYQPISFIKYRKGHALNFKLEISNHNKEQLETIFSKNDHFEIIIGFIHYSKLYVVGLENVAEEKNVATSFYEKTILAVIDNANTERTRIVTKTLDYDEIRPFSCGRAAVRKGYKWGFIDANGNIIVPVEFISIDYLENIGCLLCYDGHETFAFYQIYDTIGNILATITDPDFGYIFHNTKRIIYDNSYLEIFPFHSNSKHYGFVLLENLSIVDDHFTFPIFEFNFKKLSNFYYRKIINCFEIIAINNDSFFSFKINNVNNEFYISIDETFDMASDLPYICCVFCDTSICHYGQWHCNKNFCYWHLQGFKEECERYYSFGGSRLTPEESKNPKNVKQHYGLILFDWITKMWNEDSETHGITFNSFYSKIPKYQNVVYNLAFSEVRASNGPGSWFFYNNEIFSTFYNGERNIEIINCSESFFRDKFYFKKSDLLGTESFCKSNYGIDNESGLEVFIKILTESEYAELLNNEWQILSKIEIHPNIVDYNNLYYTENNVYAVQKFYSEGSLRNYLKKNTLTTNDIFCIIEGLLMAVKHLYQQGIIHRDIKPSNIYIEIEDDILIPKISSFELSYFENQGTNQNGLTMAYASPEQLMTEKLSRTTDIWNIGAIGYELLTGKQFSISYINEMYDSNNKDILKKAIISRIENISHDFVGQNYPIQIIEIIKKSVIYDKNSRPTADELLEILYS